MTIKWKGNERGTNLFKVSGIGGPGDAGETGSAGTTLSSIYNGSISTSSGISSPLLIGSTYVDPGIIAGTKMVFEGIINKVGGTSSTSANIIIVKRSTNTIVATLTTTATEAAFVNVILDKPTSADFYDVKLYVSNVSGISVAIANMARLRFY